MRGYICGYHICTHSSWFLFSYNRNVYNGDEKVYKEICFLRLFVFPVLLVDFEIFISHKTEKTKKVAVRVIALLVYLTFH